MWFENLMGFKEESPEQVRNNLILEGEYLISKINNKRYKCGKLEIPTLKELRVSEPAIDTFQAKLTIEEVVGNVREFHMLSSNSGALFQAASQFNLLEMTGPNVPPEYGVGIYEYDHTQGPACAIACGAGTIYRNYFVALENQIGQTLNVQVDCLSEIGKVLGNEEQLLWQMKNGYALANEAGLKNISTQISLMSSESYDDLKSRLKIGLQWNTEVTSNGNKQEVSQAYCSALPVAYSQIKDHLWEDFARLILEATYEATFYAALKNYTSTGNPNLFLTLVGGGVFGNKMEWIVDAIGKAVKIFEHTPLKVKIVSYGRSNKDIHEFVNQFP